MLVPDDTHVGGDPAESYSFLTGMEEKEELLHSQNQRVRGIDDL
jgi:hypothetical protein